MGLEEFTGKIILVSDKGEKLELERASITELTVENEKVSEFMVLNDYKVSLDVKKISKKRFIKCLMAKGYGRNGANEIAKNIHKKFGYYNYWHLVNF